MKSLKWTTAIAVLSAIPSCTGQTYTDCNPLERTCSPNPGLSTWSFTTDFTTGNLDGWTIASGDVPTTSLGAEFTINEQGDAPTIETDFYMFFGYLEVRMRTATGTGIVSTAVLQSDVLDEIDWEQVSTFPDSIQTNYFGKGNTTSYDRVTTVTVSDPESTFHTYGINWTPDSTEWYVDGTLVRTLNSADALGGENYPQTPMRVRIGVWAAGDPNNAEGTIQWAGGETDYTQAPFTMYLQSVRVVNYHPAEWYQYTDMSGSWRSISATNASSEGSTTISSSSSTVPGTGVATSSPVIPSPTGGGATGSSSVIPTTTPSAPAPPVGSAPVGSASPCATGTVSAPDTVGGTGTPSATGTADATQTPSPSPSAPPFLGGSQKTASGCLREVCMLVLAVLSVGMLSF
ncbi:concanavalin A-like lectin/glucanase domain-containing protein [Aspergillus egyptiacus]|nr:concanavalin A-like lectin/glucanase domain-containing protein [Aspergillus egyptiacus]